MERATSVELGGFMIPLDLHCVAFGDFGEGSRRAIYETVSALKEPERERRMDGDDCMG